jgi:hypothetical protein
MIARFRRPVLADEVRASLAGLDSKLRTDRRRTPVVSDRHPGQE